MFKYSQKRKLENNDIEIEDKPLKIIKIEEIEEIKISMGLLKNYLLKKKINFFSMNRFQGGEEIKIVNNNPFKDKSILFIGKAGGIIFYIHNEKVKFKKINFDRLILKNLKKKN